MAKGNKVARRVQEATGWPYSRSLEFVKSDERRRDARAYASTQRMGIGDAMVALAKAELEVELESVGAGARAAGAPS